MAEKFGGIYTTKESFTELRIRWDIGISRSKTISERLKSLLKRAESFRPLIENKIVPDIYNNNKAVFDKQGINLYGDGVKFPENSNWWKKFKEKHLGELTKIPFSRKPSLISPFAGWTSGFDAVPIKYAKTAMLTGRLYDALSGKSNYGDFNIDITDKNLYLRSYSPYLSDLQSGINNGKPIKILFIGEKQKKQWLRWIKEYFEER